MLKTSPGSHFLYKKADSPYFTFQFPWKSKYIKMSSRKLIKIMNFSYLKSF